MRSTFFPLCLGQLLPALLALLSPLLGLRPRVGEAFLDRSLETLGGRSGGLEHLRLLLAELRSSSTGNSSRGPGFVKPNLAFGETRARVPPLLAMLDFLED